MDNATRNRVLTVGGALILVALLLVCGPLEGRFGTGQVEEIPPVAAAPPPVEPEVVLPVVAPLLAALEDEVADSEPLETPPPVAVVPPVVAAVPIPVDGANSSPVTSAPAVSAAGPPAIPPVVVLPLPPTDQELAEQAADAFDASFADTAGNGSPRMIDRFPPPVASGPSMAGVEAASQGYSNMAFSPCGSPGAGCRREVPPPRARRVPVPAGP